jgi:hypothetical protein
MKGRQARNGLRHEHLDKNGTAKKKGRMKRW